MKKFTKILSLVVAVATLVGIMSTTALAANNTRFTDVADNAWYADTVKAAAEAGIIAGNANGTFDPNGTLTWAQAVTFAVRAHQYSIVYAYESEGMEAPIHIYGAADQTGSHWYDVYVNYALANGMISSVPTNPETPITRADTAKIFNTFAIEKATTYNYLPDDYFTDVPENSNGHDAILRLANIGILTGKTATVNGHATFDPNGNLLRCEMATIVSRAIDLVDRATISAN